MSNKIQKNNKLYVLILLLIFSASFAMFSYTQRGEAVVTVSGSLVATSEEMKDLELGEPIPLEIGAAYRYSENLYEEIGLFFTDYIPVNGREKITYVEDFEDRDFEGIALFKDVDGEKIPIDINSKEPAISLKSGEHEEITFYAMLGNSSELANYENGGVIIKPSAKALIKGGSWDGNSDVSINIQILDGYIVQ